MASEKRADDAYEANMETAKPDLEKSMSITQKSVGEGEVVELDEAEVFLRENGYDWAQVETILSDKQKMKALYRKVDKLLLPLLCGTYVLQYIDKSTTSYGAVFDLLSETNMTGDQYAWTASIFYFGKSTSPNSDSTPNLYLGYLFWEYPASYLAQHYRTGKVVAGTIIGWASVLMLTAACESFGTVAVCRFFLGCFEAPITPCFMLIVSMWYTREQQPFRAGCFYCCNGVGSCVSAPSTLTDDYPFDTDERSFSKSSSAVFSATQSVKSTHSPSTRLSSSSAVQSLSSGVSSSCGSSLTVPCQPRGSRWKKRQLCLVLAAGTRLVV